MKNRFKIEEHRRQVASLLAQSITEIEIAKKLNVDQSTISRDIKALKHMSQQLVFDLAKLTWLITINIVSMGLKR